jgi:hypothetical protein
MKYKDVINEMYDFGEPEKIVEYEKPTKKYTLSEGIVESSYYDNLTPMDKYNINRYVNKEVKLYDGVIGFDKSDAIANGVEVPFKYIATLETINEQKINEGPAYEYGNQISKIDKLYDVYWDAVKDLGRTLEKKGLRKEAKQLYLTYRKQVSKFSQWFSKFSGGLM